MAETQDTYLLTDEEKQAYKGLLKHAFEAATQFTGSEETYEHLMTSLISMEKFVRDRNADKMDEQLEASFAAQSGFTNTQFNTVSGLLGHASNQVYGMLARLKNLKEVLNALSIGGAYIDYSEMVYVLTDEAFPTGGEKPRETLHDFVQQPRLAILVKELQTIGVYTDDLIVRVGKVFEDKVRKLPYVVVEIPRLGKQVAVCDQYGETTFVSQNILEPYIWASYTKNQLKGLEGVQAVSFGDQWPFRVCNLLKYGTDNITPLKPPDPSIKVDIHDYERNRKTPRMVLNEDIILNHILVHLKQHQHWPLGGWQGTIEGLPGEKWQTWNSALIGGTRGLSGGSSIWKLIKNFIVHEAQNYKEVHGFLPGKNAGELIGRPDVTWDLVDKATSYSHKGDLHTLYTEGGLIKKRRGKKIIGELSPEIIMHHAVEHLKETWHWPDEYNLTPIPGLWSDYGHRNGEYWNVWDMRLWQGGRGLPGGSALYRTIWDWVTERAHQFQEEHGYPPNAGSGAVDGHPGISWDLVDHGLRTQKGWKMPLEDVLSFHSRNEQSIKSQDFPSPKNG